MLALTAPGQLTYDSVPQLAERPQRRLQQLASAGDGLAAGCVRRHRAGHAAVPAFPEPASAGRLLALLSLKPRSTGTVVVALAIVLTPQFLMFQGEIWKDMLFANAAIAGFAALAAFAKTERRRWLVLAAAAAGAGGGVRQNGVVLLPVAALALAWPRHASAGCWASGF